MRRTARLLAGLAVAFTTVVLSGSAASAHSVLLGTDPPIGGVIAGGPSELRLHFSGPVEVRFSAVQLTEPDGRQLPIGAAQRAGGGRDLVAALPSLRAGSYTVGWEVLSSDGHPATGQFGFSVGAPSGASPRLAARPARSPNLGFVAGQVRFAWFAAFMFLVGAAALRRLVWGPAVRASGPAASRADDRFRGWFAKALPAAWAVLAASGGAALVFEAATVSGGSLSSALRPAVLSRLLGTSYGHLWMAQTALTLALALPVLALSRRGPAGPDPRRWRLAGALLAGSIAAVAVANGHAGSAPHPLLPVVVLAGHLLAASVWAGGLAALVLLGLPAWRTPAPADDAGPGQSLAREVLFRFSRLALFSTAALIVTGVLGSRGNLGVLANLWRVAYGRMLLAKLVLLAVALVLGARHLLVLPRRLAVPEPAGRGPRGRALASFGRTSRAEAIVLAAAVAVAAALVSAVPGRFAQVAASHPVDMRQAIGGHNVELVVAPTGPGPNQLLLSFVGGDGVLVEGLDRATATLRQPDGSTLPLDLTALSSGAFSASVSLPTAGPYRVAVSDPAGNSTTFSFKVPKPLPG